MINKNELVIDESADTKLAGNEKLSNEVVQNEPVVHRNLKLYFTL